MIRSHKIYNVKKKQPKMDFKITNNLVSFTVGSALGKTKGKQRQNDELKTHSSVNVHRSSFIHWCFDEAKRETVN